MKRAMTGGAHRGPVAHGRQRRTIRLMQAVLVIVAAALLLFAGYSWGRTNGFDDARASDQISFPRAPGAGQVIVPAALALVAIGTAVWLGGPGGVRIPTPARLEELAGRAEDAAVRRAENAAESRPKHAPERTG